MSPSQRDEHRIDIQKILDENEKVDRDQLAEALQAVEDLEAYGIEDVGYDLVLPFTPQVRRDDSSKRRAIFDDESRIRQRLATNR